MDLKQFAHTVAVDFETGLAHLEQDAVADVAAAWGWARDEFLKLLPKVDADLLQMAETAVAKALEGGSNEIGDIMTSLVQLGEVNGRNLLTEFGEDALNVVASLAKSKVNAAGG